MVPCERSQGKHMCNIKALTSGKKVIAKVKVLSKLEMIVNVPFVIIIQKHLLIYFSTVHMFIECGLIFKTG